MVGAGGQSEVGVAAGFGENLHFGINAAEASASGVGKSEISVHKGIARLIGAIFQRETAVPNGEMVPKFCKDASGVLSGIRLHHAVMQVNFDLSPTGMTVVGEHLQQSFVVLFSRIKICVTEGMALMIAIGVDELRKDPAPILEATLLFVVRSPSSSVFGYDTRLEMIG